MTLERQVYLLDPQTLPPETIAVTFAKTSRSPQSFREIAAELSDEKSAQFHEKWVVGYGHSSVAEHAILHIAIENISRLAVESLESNRLASYTEKSTRYQKWGLEEFIIPPELEDHPLRESYTRTCRLLLDSYHRFMPVVQQLVMDEHPRQQGESETAWKQRIRPEYIDVCRFLLPAASLANVGVTINARALEHAICKMLSHPLAEVRATGQEIKQAAQAVIPTLVKYANPTPYLENVRLSLQAAANRAVSSPGFPSDWCHLVHYDEEAEIRVLSAALYRFSGIGYTQASEYIRSLSLQEKQILAGKLLTGLNRHDIPLRELEHAYFTFDLILDQGAFAELKRHRMLTLTPQPLTTRLGFAIPHRITAASLEQEYRTVMEEVSATYEHLANFSPEVAAYLVPNAFNRRVMITLNLRSADHLLNLRTASNAHFSIRRVAQRMASQLRDILPLFGSLLRANQEETWQEIEEKYFTQVM